MIWCSVVASKAGSSWATMTPAPLLGEHTDDVLTEELGLENLELDRLAATGVTARVHAMAAD